MLFISDSEFERVISRSRNRMLAHKFYENGSVIRVHIVQDKKGYYISGQVSANGVIYSPRIEVTPQSKIAWTSCDCIFSDEYTACAHIGAILLAVQDLAPKEFPFTYSVDYGKLKKKREEEERKRALEYKNFVMLQQRRHREQAALDLTQLFKDDLLSTFETQVEPVHIHIEYKNNSYRNAFRFRIGRESMYLIQNHNEFIDNMENHVSKKYGKNFTWRHHEEDLDEYSKRIYQFLKGSYNPSSYDKTYLSNSQREGLIQLIETLPDHYFNSTIVEDVYRPALSVSSDEYDYIIKLTNDNNMHIGKNIGFILSDVVYTFSFDQGGKVLKLLDHLRNNKMLYIPKEEMSSFYQYVLQPIMSYIDITGLPLDYYSKTEDQIKIYGDINEDEEAYFQVMGIYGDQEINVLEHPDQPRSPHMDMITRFMEKYDPDMAKGTYFYDTYKDKAIDFLSEGLPVLAQYADIYVSENLKHINRKNKFDIKIGVSVSEGLLNIDFDSLDIPKDELASILKSYSKKKKYHKLKDGSLLHIESDELEELSRVMNQYHIASEDIVDGHVDMNLNRAFSLNASMDHMEYIQIDRSESFHHIIERLANYKQKHYELASPYDHILRDYQKEGYQWLSTMCDLQFGGILADDMGLGKTLQMIALLENQEESFSIVVCPSSLVLNWIDEFRKFAPQRKVKAVMGNASERHAIIKEAHQYNTLITSYDYMRRDAEHYDGINFDFIILDEAQYIKNQNTKNAKSVKLLHGKHKFALTGTPIENSLAELWSIFDFLEKDYLFNYHYFRQHYEAPIVKDHDEDKLKELKEMISPFVLRRTKSIVLKELPDKVEKSIHIEFNKEEKKLYLAHLAQANEELRQLSGNNDRIQILALLTKLRQICCEPRMLFENIKKQSSKMEACMDIVDNYYENNKKLLIFSSFSSVLNLIEEELKKRHISYHMITGSTPKIKRKEYVDAFQNDDSTVFLISLKAGGTGLNLTAAEGVIHFDPWWNMSAQMQATDRAHRIGQENKVFVYKLIMSDSIEEKIQDIQEKKKELADTFVEGNEGHITTMTNEEIMSLFQ